MKRNENLLFGRHFETVQTFFFLEYGCDKCIYNYGVEIVKTVSGWKVVILGGSISPYALTAVRNTFKKYAVKC